MSAKGETPAARFRQLSRAAAAIAVGVGVSVVVGWWRDIDFLKSMLPGTNSMKVNTAVCLALAGFSLWFLQPEAKGFLRKEWQGRLGQALALTLTLVSLLTLSQYLTGLDLGLDQLLFPDRVSPVFPGRMAPHTALAFVLLGAALLLLDVRTTKGAWPAQLPAALAGWTGLAGVIGHAYGAVPLFRLGSLQGMAIHSSGTIVILTLGILLARHERGIVRLLTREGLGRSLARWLLPAAVLVPFAVGWLRLLGENAGLYDTGLGVALFALLTIAVLMALVYRSALAIDRLESERKQAQAERGPRRASNSRSARVQSSSAKPSSRPRSS